MKKEKKCKYESLTIRQAQHMNLAEEAQLRVVHKFINSEEKRRSDDIDKARKRFEKTLEAIRKTAPVPADVLHSFHQDKKSNLLDVVLHISNCYMQKQDRNKAEWIERQSSKDILQRLPPELPVKTPDNLTFLADAFPEVYNMSVGLDWTYEKASKVDIYEHGRAGHDMKCMSTRATPVGNYNTRGPLNFR